MDLNKQTFLQLVDRIEELLDENIALKAYVKGLHRMNPNAPTPFQVIEGKRHSQGTPSLASELCAPLRAQVQQASDAGELAEALLKNFPASKQVN